jgi:hypothetical protein
MQVFAIFIFSELLFTIAKVLIGLCAIGLQFLTMICNPI